MGRLRHDNRGRAQWLTADGAVPLHRPTNPHFCTISRTTCNGLDAPVGCSCSCVCGAHATQTAYISEAASATFLMKGEPKPRFGGVRGLTHAREECIMHGFRSGKYLNEFQGVEYEDGACAAHHPRGNLLHQRLPRGRQHLLDWLVHANPHR